MNHEIQIFNRKPSTRQGHFGKSFGGRELFQFSAAVDSAPSKGLIAELQSRRPIDSNAAWCLLVLLLYSRHRS